MRIGVLGAFEVCGPDGEVVDVPGARLRGLLIALALETGHVVGKAALVDWIWGSRPPADEVNSLHRLVSRLRKVLPAGAIEGHPEGYRLTLEPGAVDAVHFERLISAPQTSEVSAPQSSEADAARTDARTAQLREAVALWRGEPFQDAGVQDSVAFDAAVTRLTELRLTALAHPGVAGITQLTAAVAAHPTREALAGALMRALAAEGRGNEALQVYQRTREALADELGADPSPELSALHVALLRGGREREERRTNLRAELTSYVGKDADVAAVRGLVTGNRLTTLIGPGGSGKTRLATEIGRALVGTLPDGAWLVELAATGPGGDVAQATLAGLGLRDTLLGAAPGDDTTDRIVSAIRDRDMLLILDNCEHLIEPAAEFAHRLLGECRRLRILATSREPLGITGEALWPVEPLVPESAVRLLRDRAGALRQDLGDDAATNATLNRVCRALDGMPLAIELAAARLRTMSLDQLATRLDDRFRLLTTGSRTAQRQHKTLRAVVDWSWELLSDAERTVLRRLAVFSGGASLEAAERVCSDVDALELLTSLTDKSLLRTDGSLRYRMQEIIKEYAAHRLAEAGELDLARQAHLAWFTELAETAEPHLRRADQVRWLAVLEAEHDNIVAAMRGALAAGEAQSAMRLAAAAGWYWWLGGRKAEGLELIMAAAELRGEVDDGVRATVYALIVHFLTSGRSGERETADWIRKAHASNHPGARRHPAVGFIGALERIVRAPGELLPAFEALLDDEDPWVRALARLHLGKMRIVLGHSGGAAESYLESALAEFRALGERFGISFALTELADRIAVRGEFARAAEYYEQAITAVTEVGANEDVIRLRARQAQLYRLLGDEPAAAASLAEAQRLGERVTWPDALADLALTKSQLARWAGDSAAARAELAAATAALGDGELAAGLIADQLGYLADDPGEAREYRAEAVKAAAQAGYAPLVAQVLVGVADLAAGTAQFTAAARLMGAADAVRGTPDLSNPDATRIAAAALAALGEERYAESAREGSRADWHELAAVTLAS